MAIRWGCCSVAFGNVNVKTPFSILAFTSSGYRSCQRQTHSTIDRRATYLGSKGHLQRPRKRAVATLTNLVPTLLLRVGGGRLAGYRQAVVVNVDSDILGLQSGQLECRRHGVGVLGFVEVEPSDKVDD